MLENPVNLSLPKGDNVKSADDQQERLDGDRHPESSETVRQTGLPPEDTVRAAWRHAELGRNDPAS